MKFKKGDRVRCNTTSGGDAYTKGKIYIVKKMYASGERFETERDDKGSTTNGWHVDFFELAILMPKRKLPSWF